MKQYWNNYSRALSMAQSISGKCSKIFKIVKFDYFEPFFFLFFTPTDKLLLLFFFFTNMNSEQATIHCSSVYNFFLLIFSLSPSLSLHPHPSPSPSLLISVGLPLSTPLRCHQRPPETTVPAPTSFEASHPLPLCHSTTLPLRPRPITTPRLSSLPTHWGWQHGHGYCPN